MRRQSLLATSAAFLMLLLAWTPIAEVWAGAKNTAREEARMTAERQARAEIESLIGRLCPGRCELVELKVSVAEPRALGQVHPGFEGAPGTQFETEVRRIEATILMDSQLPDNFQSNIPRMAQFRLQDLAQTVEVRPEVLEFPQPQLPPMPDPMPRQPRQPPPMPEPLPQPEPVAEPEPQAQADTSADEQHRAETPLWQELLPWIALLLTLLILGGLIILILRRLEDIAEARSEVSDEHMDNGASTGPVSMPDAETLREDLKRSRSALNRMLRRWVDEDPEEVACLVRLVGPAILADLRRDPELRPALELVSDHVASQDETIEAEQAQAIARKARSRLDAQLVVDDGTGEAEWEFLEGLTLGQITTLLKSASRRERGFVLTRLSPVLRSRYLENLSGGERRELLLEASSAETLSRSQSRELAGRLRQVADEFTDAGRQAAGQADMIIEMLEAMHRSEQEEVLRDLNDNRPDVADAVLSRICLESTLLILPPEVVSNAVHRVPVEVLTTFLQGCDDSVTNSVLDNSPAAKRQAVATELSLDIPTTRADFLDARQTVLTAVVSTLKRDGYDIARFNSQALERPATQDSPTTEVVG